MSPKAASKAASAGSAPRSREQEFARAALARKLVTREHAEECLRAAHDLAKRGKALAIEEIFVRKGYLRRADAQAIARALPAAAPKTAKLELAEGVGATHEYAAKGRRCPSCDKAPGRAEDYCPRCGADLETGGPGPDATMCPSCSRVVKKGAAVCPRCAMPIERSRMGRRGTGSGWVDRLVVLAAVAGCFYFLVYRHVIAPAPPPGSVEAEGATNAERIRDAMAKGDNEALAKALEEAIKEEGHDPALEPAFALACLRSGRKEDARGAIFNARQKHPNDVDLMLIASEIAVAASDLDAAKRTLALVPRDGQDDRFHREEARYAQAAKDGALLEKALLALKSPTPVETHRLAELHLERGVRLSDEGKNGDALLEVEKAVKLDPKWSLAREKLGVVFLRMRNWPAAEIQFGRAAELDREKPDVWLGLAVARDKKKDPRAADDYRAFARKAKDDPRYAAAVAAATARVAELEPHDKK